MKSKTITLNGRKVSYFDDGRGYPLVLIHGWMVCKFAFEPLGEILKKDYRIIAIDLPGHGDSGELNEKHDLDNYCKFLEQFFDKLNLEKFHLMGTSLGGSLAILYTLRNEKRVNKLILQAPLISCEQVSNKFKISFLKTCVKALSRVSPLQNFYHDHFWNYVLKKRLPRIKNHVTSDRWAEIKKSVQAVANVFNTKLSRKASSEFAVSALDMDLTKKVRKIKNKTLIIWGSKDTTLNKKWGLKLKNNMTSAKYLEIKDGTHDVLIEKYSEMAKEIKFFLNENRF